MMIIRQLSVFLENKPGRLCAATDTLAKKGINISALTLADTAEFGILRLIVDQPDLAREVLTESGVVVRISEVIAVAMDDAPGGAGGILHLLSEAGLNVEYMYAFANGSDASAVLKSDNPAKVVEVLKSTGFDVWDADEAYRANC